MTDLDRLLELVESKCNGDGMALSDKDQSEFESLKSQLESKLVECQRLKEENNNLKFTICDLQDCYDHADCKREIDRLRQTESQHTNLVKAIQDKIAKLESEKQQLLKKLEDARNENATNLENDGKNPNDTDCYPSYAMETTQNQIDEIVPQIEELQNLLESTKESKA